MKKISLSILVVFLSLPNIAFSADLNDLAQEYYKAWVETQQPNAPEQSLTNYLSLLTNDVGHQHLPYDPESTREPDNKQNMLKGMSYYLGTHTKYKSELISVVTGYNVIIIKYSTSSEGIHPQTKELIKQEYNTVEVLELENEKVAVIRKYSE